VTGTVYSVLLATLLRLL